MKEAELHGYPIDKQFVVETFDNILGSRETMLAAKLLGTTRRPLDRLIGRYRLENVPAEAEVNR